MTAYVHMLTGRCQIYYHVQTVEYLAERTIIIHHDDGRGKAFVAYVSRVMLGMPEDE